MSAFIFVTFDEVPIDGLARFVGERPTSRIYFENRVAIYSIESHLFREVTPEMLDRYSVPPPR
jgi:hypothetical protein